VRLHGLKDYYDMAALAGEFPRLRLTFNLVPSLLDQIDDYAAGTAMDPAIDLARRPASDLNEQEVLALLDLFFSVPYRTLIAPYPRYSALFHKRGDRGPDDTYREALAHFKTADLRDLQVWFHLAWCGRTLRLRPEIRNLISKGAGFTEDEKISLLNMLDAFLAQIVPIHRRLRDEGIAEISTSPYYHPILPLLCDQESAREAVPGLPLPEVPLRRPSDALWQIRRALDSMQQRFGERPAGMWPSEGSLSEAVLRIMGECSVRWTASDEGVLKASIGDAGPGGVHGPWRVDSAGEAAPSVFFRDTGLSDRIGFTYASWRPADAAADFIGHLRNIAQQSPGGVVSIILDGENAWEYYSDNGTAFLRALYGALTQAPDIETVTLSQALESSAPVRRLGRLRAGSWIGATFTTWIGHSEKNRAWSLLAQARNEAEHSLGAALESSPVFPLLAAAEGSDWFWWFGDDHSSEQDAIFDSSFRELLRGIYRMLGVRAPEELDQPIKRTGTRSWTEPTGPIAPTIDGAVTDYFEWLMAGQCDTVRGQGAMHQAAGLIRRIAFGSDGRSLFVRIDPERGTVRDLLGSLPGGVLSIDLMLPARQTARFHLEGDRETQLAGGSAVRYAGGKVLEVEIPLTDSTRAQFSVSLASEAGAVQRLPREGAIVFSPAERPDWSV
jgi:alpha-amylase/alpha-mannosidase (GH57 family)